MSSCIIKGMFTTNQILGINSQHPVYVEDYISVLAHGFTTADHRHRAVKLASYDVGVLNSLAQQVDWEQRALTHRQAELVLRLIEKYTRQLKALGIDNRQVLDADTRQYRMAPRTIDREHSIQRQDHDIVMRFPYTQRLIDCIRSQRQDLDGHCEWDPDARVWRFGLTESNLSFVMTLATMGEFQVDAELQDLFQQLGQVEQQGHEIRLVETQDGYTIENAATSLVDYVQAHLGGFGAANLVTLVDHAAVLGYTVSTDIVEHMRRQHGDNITSLLMSHRNNIEPKNLSISDIYRYAMLVQRRPILIYCPNPSPEVLAEVTSGQVIPTEAIYVHSRNRRRDFDAGVHQVFFTQVLDRAQRIDAALKISFQNISYGANRMRWLNSPGKIVYYCTELKPRE
jgi:hypothetical protein